MLGDPEKEIIVLGGWEPPEEAEMQQNDQAPQVGACGASSACEATSEL